MAQLAQEFKGSIKSPDTEEKLDLILYRPLGFLIAKTANIFRMNPTQLSLLGLLSGWLAAYYYLQRGDTGTWFIASLLFVLSGIFDSSDGQLARISGKTTKLGLVLDGICDSFVTIAIYISASWPYFEAHGPWYFFVMFPALFMHSSQCAILDFYHREYLYFGYGKIEDDTYWNPGVKEAIANVHLADGKKDRLLSKLRISWIKQQQFLTTRSDEERQKWRAFLKKATPEQAQEFGRLYREKNLKLLPFWRLLGSNFHTFSIITFLYFGRFDLYMYLFDYLLLNLVIVVMAWAQKRTDEKFVQSISHLL